MTVFPFSYSDIEESVNRLQSTFRGHYPGFPIVEDDRTIGTIRTDTSRIYITFRGSVDSFWEMLTCLDARKVSMDQVGLSGKVHRGIFTAFSKIHGVVLKELIRLGSQKQIIVEGYSRGAGIATLLGAYLQAQLTERSITVLAYSPMRIFDQTAALDNRINALPIHNFICQEDWIPSLIPSCLGFFRFGKEHIFSAETLPEYGNRVRDRIYVHLMEGWIGKIVKSILPARIWEAHMPETYREGAPIFVQRALLNPNQPVG